MQVENHKEEVPFSHYAGLFAQMDPQEALARWPGLPFDEGAFTMTLLGRTYRVLWPSEEVRLMDDGPAPSLPTQTYLLRILLEGKEVPSAGTYKTFREMPWGEMYIGPYTGRVLTRAAFTFGTKLPAFRAACEKLGAERLSHGDAGYRFRFFGPYFMEILLWAGDEEFPPSAQVLYSDNFAEGFAAEDRVVAGDLLIGAIRAAM